jgi:hypothetical protein
MAEPTHLFLQKSEQYHRRDESKLDDKSINARGQAAKESGSQRPAGRSGERVNKKLGVPNHGCPISELFEWSTRLCRLLPL